MPERIDWNTLTKDLLDKYGGQAPRYTSYPTVPAWDASFAAHDFGTALEACPADGELSLYCHIPFCRKRCRFCGCASDVSTDTAQFDRYLDALAREVAMVSDRLGPRAVRQLHLGGGTPTVLDPDRLTRLMAILTTPFELPARAAEPPPEIALEAAPAVTTEAQIHVLAGLGFNRISLGVQDFTREVQEAVDRIQGEDHTRRLIELARGHGFDINLDLMYGLPRQRPETWRRTLDTVTDLRPNRLAVFGYAHVPWMRPHQKALEAYPLPDADQRLELFRMAHDALLDAGYVYIGMDHFALPEDPLAAALSDGSLSRNFQGYTVKQASMLIGFGATAISDLGAAFAQNRPVTGEYTDRIETGRLATFRGMRTSDEDRLRRHIITELMCNLVLDIPATERRFGVDFTEHFKAELSALRELEADGLVRVEDAAITVTGTGRMFVRHVGTVFDAYLTSESARPRFSRTV